METLEYHELVPLYYGSRLEIHGHLKTSASCMSPSTPIPQSTFDALRLVHPSVCKKYAKYSGCGLVVPEKLQRCKVLGLGSGSGRDCFILSKLVGQSGHVIGIDMTILASCKYVQYHQEKYGYEKPNTIFVEGYIEKLNETGIQSGSLDVLVSNCAMCLCPDKKPVLREAFRVLKWELYFSDIYSSKAVPEHLKQTQFCEGLSGVLYWRDLISLVHEVGFSTPYLLTASHIIVHNSELQKKASGITHTSATYRLFKLPKNRKQSDSVVAYKGTVPDHPDLLKFDMYHCFEVCPSNLNSQFSSDFSIQSSDKPAPSPKCAPQINPLVYFLLAIQKPSCICIFFHHTYRP
uniref:Arsenite methyltransferase n=1 Tax=Hucho hucho TaxID=62062 RepID=A0A4W5LP88_9TELE